MNNTNNPTVGLDAVKSSGGSREAKVYTVFSHPVPEAALQPVVAMARTNSTLHLAWNADAGLFTVQTTGQVEPSGTVWTDFTTGNVAPPVSVPITAANRYFRLLRRY